MKEQILEFAVMKEIDNAIESAKHIGSNEILWNFSYDDIETKDKMILIYVYSGYKVAADATSMTLSW